MNFDCAADEPVLVAAHRANILMPYSCRGGQCGACRGLLLRGEVAYPQGRPPALAPGDALAGYALFCSARPCSDLVIERAPPGF